MNKEIRKNNDLAFNLAVDMLDQYAQKCERDSKRDMMNPILGTYNLVNQLAIGLLFKADGHIDDVIDIMNIAIQDAKEVIIKTKGEE